MNTYNGSTRLDAAQTQPGFLDVKMQTKIVTPPTDLVAVLGAEARLSCQVSVLSQSNSSSQYIEFFIKRLVFHSLKHCIIGVVT